MSINITKRCFFCEYGSLSAYGTCEMPPKPKFYVAHPDSVQEVTIVHRGLGDHNVKRKYRAPIRVRGTDKRRRVLRRGDRPARRRDGRQYRQRRDGRQAQGATVKLNEHGQRALTISAATAAAFEAAGVADPDRPLGKVKTDEPVR